MSDIDSLEALIREAAEKVSHPDPVVLTRNPDNPFSILHGVKEEGVPLDMVQVKGWSVFMGQDFEFSVRLPMELFHTKTNRQIAHYFRRQLQRMRAQARRDAWAEAADLRQEEGMDAQQHSDQSDD